MEWAIATHGMYESPVALLMFIFYVVFNWKKLVIIQITDFCADTSPDVFQESGCTVHGKSVPT